MEEEPVEEGDLTHEDDEDLDSGDDSGPEAFWKELTRRMAASEKRAGKVTPEQRAARLVRPAQLRGPAGARRRAERAAPGVPTAVLGSREEIEEEKLNMVLDKLGEGTRRAYALGWKWWWLFCRARGTNPLLRVGAENMEEVEQFVMDFLVHLAVNCHKGASTIKQYLSAVRAQHVALGLPEPFKRMARAWAFLDGLKKRSVGRKKRRAVTPKMLRWLRSGLRPHVSADDAALWLAVTLGFFFLLRSREYVVEDGFVTGDEYGLCGADLTARAEGDGAPCFRDADEVVLELRRSKTDQMNVGHVMNQYRSGDPSLCVVAALEDYERHYPGRLRGGDRHAPLLVWADGTPLTRSDVQKALRRAAVAAGMDPEDIGSHSLRIGGASALWAAYKDSALVQRWGRWQTGTFHRYLWEGRDAARGVATAMAETNLEGI